ncbi:MAG: FtsW/RodA/SpoVE family cell cycle protein [Lachnospiraceae bacterium]|nr:FtsW/RodA/SpoVE family cell cycle protein [Lachnospiraceae bacterium]
MRLYILEISRYALAAILAVYTLLAFQMLFRQKDESVQKVNGILQVLLILAFLGTGSLTVAAGFRDLRYLFLGALEILFLGGAIVLFHTIYDHANMLLYHNACMLMSIGFVIISRFSLRRSAKQFSIALIGLILSLVLPLLRKKISRLKEPVFLYALGFAGVIALGIVLVLGSAIQGANLNYSIFGITFQPSEFVKILFVIFTAGCLSTTGKGWMSGLFAAAHVLILVFSRDLGSAVIFFVVYVLMLFEATGKWWVLPAGAGSGAVGAYLGYRIFTHVQVRVQAFLDPWSVIDSMGYQITQSLFAISFGGPFGTGLTQGASERIPYALEDFIFAPIAEELGLICAMCLILLCLNSFLLLLFMSLNYGDKFYQLCTFGIAAAYGFQNFLTIGGETKFIPLTGVTLPFVSYGGSSILATILMFTFAEMLAMLQGEKIEAFRIRFEQEEEQRREEEERRRRREEMQRRQQARLRRQQMRQNRPDRPEEGRPLRRSKKRPEEYED